MVELTACFHEEVIPMYVVPGCPFDFAVPGIVFAVKHTIAKREVT